MTASGNRARRAAGLVAVGLLIAGCSGTGSQTDSQTGSQAGSGTATGTAGPGSTASGSAPAATGSAGTSGGAAAASGTTGGTRTAPLPSAGTGAGSAAAGAPSAGPAAPPSHLPTPRPSLAPPAAPPVTAVPGYAYSTAPASVVKAFAALAAAKPGVFSAPTVRTVKRGSTTVGSVAVLALNSAYVGRPTVERQLVDGMIRGLSGKGYTLSDHALSGVRVVGASSKTSSAVVWYRSGTMVLVVSNTVLAVPVAYAQAYLLQT